MNKKHLIPGLLVVSVVALLCALFFQNLNSLAVLNPAGEIASKQKNLLVFTLLLSLVVVIPVFVMTFWFAWKYRETNSTAKYSPDWDHSLVAEAVWWTVPLILILILAGITYQSSHQLDPFKPLNSSKQPLTIQVIAMDWKWLFIYPDQNIASLNYVQFPKATPVKFEITSDAPMNSFWIPQLGGQIYAMSGMSTHLNLMADNTGLYRGSSANISGRGFAGMNFYARSSTDAEFDKWVTRAKESPNELYWHQYLALSKPSQNNLPKLYSKVDPSLYDTIVMKYMPGVSQSASLISEDSR